jgi:hypothetical protein
MAKAAARTLRDLRIAARKGDLAAMRFVLRLNGRPELAAQVRRGKPVPRPVWKMVLAATAGTGTRDTLTEWEHREEDGTIVNDLLDLPSPHQRQRERP